MDKARFQKLTADIGYPDGKLTARDLARLRSAVTDAKNGDPVGREQVCATLAWIAFSCPQETTAAYDTLSQAWLNTSEMPGINLNGTPTAAPLHENFWSAFWQVVEGPIDGYDAISITEAVAGLGATVDENFAVLAEQYATDHPGATAAVERAMPGLTDIMELGHCSPGTLGRELHDMLIDNGYDPEVLDRDAISLSSLPPAMRYLNTRILQMHDVWHLVAGYRTTGIQEIAISAFQLAQFAHNYSSMFLAVVMMISHSKQPRGFAILMQIIAEAWRHGRSTPNLMDIQWEDEWHTSIPDIRQKYGIRPHSSALPADLLETFAGDSFLKKLKLGLTLVRFNNRLKAA